MKRIIAIYNKNKKTYLSILGALVVVVLYLMPDVVFAAPAAPVAETTSIMREINEVINEAMKMTSAWLWPVIMMIGSLLDNDLIFGGVMGDRLLSVWVEIRNLVNIIFVLILLGIALYNVLGIGEEGGLPLSFKTAMPKFVLALIAVNFSFIGIKVLLDFTNVITGAVFALPTTAVEESISVSDVMKKNVCSIESKDTPMYPLFCKGNELNERAQAFFSRLDRSNITIAYAVRFGKAVTLKFVNGGIKDITQLTFNVLFNLILYIVYGVSFIVLFLVLLFRVVVLWVAVVMSPIIALGIVLPNLKELGGDTGKIKEKFVAHLIAPIKIGLVLAVGYIMLDGFQADKAIHGLNLASITMSSVDPNAIPTDINDLQQLMIAIATVVILWVGVFQAADGTTASVITSTIDSWGKGAAKWVGTTAPQLIPLVPVGNKKGTKYGRNLAQMIGSGRQIWNDKIGGLMRSPLVNSATAESTIKGHIERGDFSSASTSLKESMSMMKQDKIVELLKDIAIKSGNRELAINIGRAKDRPADLAGVVSGAAVFKGAFSDPAAFATAYRTAGSAATDTAAAPAAEAAAKPGAAKGTAPAVPAKEPAGTQAQAPGTVVTPPTPPVAPTVATLTSAVTGALPTVPLAIVTAALGAALAAGATPASIAAATPLAAGVTPAVVETAAEAARTALPAGTPGKIAAAMAAAAAAAATGADPGTAANAATAAAAATT